MFKKNVTVSGSQQLGGKDIKKLKTDRLTKAFPALTDEERDALFPPKAPIVQLKLSNRSVVFALEGGNPLFFDPNGHGDKLLPTVYALTLVPHLIPTLHTWSEVSSKVLSGADLFLQGVLVPDAGLPDFLAGSARAVAVPGNAIPFGVGVMAVSKAEAVREGMKGRGLTVMHTYKDLLWQLGDKEAPNAGFTAARIFALPGGETGAADVAGVAAPVEGAEAAAQQQLGALTLEEGDTSTGNDSGVCEEQSGTSEADAPGVDMDALLEAAVMGGLYALQNSDLPITTSDFYAKFMQPLRPEGVALDLKASRYKKLSKLLDAFEKDKVMTQKQVRKQDHITAVNRSHPRYLAWQESSEAAASSGTTVSNSSGSKAAGGARNGSTPSAGGATSAAVIELRWRAPSSLLPVFVPGGARDKEALYSQQEVAQALEGYAQAQGLARPGGAVAVDHLLVSALWGKKEAPSEGTSVPTPEVFRRLLSKLQPWHRIQRPAGEEGRLVEVLRRGAPKAIGVSAERRHGHNVTLITRVEGWGFSADELASVFARRLKTASRVSKLPGKAENDSEILLQGDLAKQAAAYFTATAGLPAEYVEVVNKLKK